MSFHPDNYLPDCMMPDGSGGACAGQLALWEDWHKQHARIEALEARNSDLVTQCDTHAQHKMAFKNRIEVLQEQNRALEAALREIKDCLLTPDQSSTIARKALAPAREENDDVFPGFRGNNDYA